MINPQWEAAKVWRQGLKPGNGVAIYHRGARRDQYSIGAVTRVTATQILATNAVGREMRFNREYGREVGPGSHDIVEITPQIRASIKEARDRSEFGALCYRPDNLPADEIAVMLEALKTHRAYKETPQSEQ